MKLSASTLFCSTLAFAIGGAESNMDADGGVRGYRSTVDGFLVIDLPGGLTDFSSWRPPPKGFDERGFYVCGVQSRYQSSQGAGNDRALSGLRVKYCHLEDWNIQEPPLATSGDWFSIEEGGHGLWRSQVMCPKDYYVVGARMRVEAQQRPIRDNKGLTGLEIRCKSKLSSQTTDEIVWPGSDGSWKGWCPGPECGTYTVGNRFVRKIEVRYGSDVGIADLKFEIETPHNGVSRRDISSSWNRIQSGPSLNQVAVTHFLRISNTVETTRAQQIALSAKISIGFKYKGVGLTIGVDKPSSEIVVESVSNTIESSTSVTSTLDCPSKESPTGIWVMWQWTMEQELDEYGPGFYMQTKEFKCTPGSPPRCPLAFCKDEWCQFCLDPFENLSAPSSAPTPMPTPNPTPAPTLAPTPAPTPAPTRGPTLFPCFSGKTSVRVLQGEVEKAVPMQDIHIGDRILTKSGNYQPVFAWSHVDRTAPTDFLQISMTGGSPLEITGGHFIYVRGRKGPVTASSLKVGDVLVGRGAPLGKDYNVTSIKKIRRTGFYSPLTVDGTIIVADGVAASSYADMQGMGKGRVQLGGLPLPLEQTDIIHMYFSPLRLVCASSRWAGSCNNETKTNLWSTLGLHFHEFSEKTPVVSQLFLYSFMLLVLIPFAAIEFALSLDNAKAFAVAILVVSIIHSWRKPFKGESNTAKGEPACPPQ